MSLKLGADRSLCSGTDVFLYHTYRAVSKYFSKQKVVLCYSDMRWALLLQNTESWVSEPWLIASLFPSRSVVCYLALPWLYSWSGPNIPKGRPLYALVSCYHDSASNLPTFPLVPFDFARFHGRHPRPRLPVSVCTARQPAPSDAGARSLI